MKTIAPTGQKTTMNLQSGLEIIAGLPLSNPQQAYLQIKDFLDNLLKAPPAADVYIELLEHLRPSLCFVAEDLARHFVNKPLPLGDVDEEKFRQAIIVWIKMARSYAACTKLMRPEEAVEQQALFAMVAHRCLYYMGMAQIEHQRARREQPPELWHDLYRHYTGAENRNVALLPVSDPLDQQGRDPSCSSAFLGLLLYELANPYGLSVSDQNLVRVWADNWSELVSIRRGLSQEAPSASLIDLAEKIGLRAKPGEQAPRLDTSRLVAHLKEIRSQLEQKVSPAKLGLGASCSLAQCKRLLEQLAHSWSQGAPRRFPRRATSGEARLCIGFSAAHAGISGAMSSASGPEQATEAWQTLDQSVEEFRLTRGSAGEKVALGQLLAICPHDGVRFLLARVTSLMQKRRDGLIASVAVLPGLPEAIELRVHSPADHLVGSRAQAFLLPAISTNAKSSLVVPPGWHQDDRIVDVLTSPKQRLRIKRLMASGTDFEQVRFAIEPG